MVSGNPVLSTRINGIPDEYFDYIIPLDSLDATYLKNKILEVAAMPREKREELGARAKSFVLSEKNNVKQAEKIINFTKE